jgi:hypothetical protein
MLDLPNGNVIASGSYYGGPDYEFFVAEDEHVYFRVVGDASVVWAGPNIETFRQIVNVWNRYRSEVRASTSEEAQLARVAQMRSELSELGAFPEDLPSDPEPLWSLLVFEAENGLG